MARVRTAAPGDAITIDVRRNRRVRSIDVVLGRP
jgi:hypothetical protein